MSLYKNKEFIKIGGSKTRTVTFVIDVDAGAKDDVVLRNVAVAAKALADYGDLQTWVRKIEVRDGGHSRETY